MRAAPHEIVSLLDELNQLRESCVALEREFEEPVSKACAQSRHSAKNLLDYLALRKHDLRDLQARLAALGLSSLGRSESNALAGLDAVIGIVEQLVRQPASHVSRKLDGAAFKTGPATLARNAKDLLGPAPRGRAVRIMVTLPSEAGHSSEAAYQLVKSLVEDGTDVIRINCAHDSPAEWQNMIANLRQANQETGRHCKILMDLAGPKLRTGAIRHGYRVARWHVRRDVRGFALSPARIALTGKQGTLHPPSGCDAALPVSEGLLREVTAGDTIRIVDSRQRERELTVLETSGHACVCSCDRAGYVLSRAEVTIVRDGKQIASGHLGELPFVEEPIRLRPADSLVLAKEDAEPPKGLPRLPSIACTLPEVFSTVQPGQPIFFDDGKIEGRIRQVHPDRLLVEIVHSGAQEAKLGSAKGINLPETEFNIGALTAKDLADLDFVAAHADIVGLSFVRRPGDVLELLKELEARQRSDLGIILKIESRPAFDQLPMIMMAALRHHPVGIMVARGDLAIEVGFERLAEVQEEILWLSEAAHIPVIWATQVLETLAKTGIPSRAEVTDAAMGVRAECVMLNKGPHILEAVRFLDDILHRMRAHHLKKRSMLRRLAVAQIKPAARHGHASAS